MQRTREAGVQRRGSDGGTGGRGDVGAPTEPRVWKGKALEAALCGAPFCSMSLIVCHPLI